MQTRLSCAERWVRSVRNDQLGKGPLQRRDILGGLLQDYYRNAA
jgi:hypothetical protein